MQGLLNLLKNDLVQKVIITVITALVTYYFTSRKNKQEQSIKHQNLLGEKISEAYLKTREIIQECNTINSLDLDEDISVENILAFTGYAIYPNFMENKENLFAFIEKLSGVRKDEEPYLDLKTSAMLYAMERYFINLSLFIRENDLEKQLPLLGCIVVIDTTRWSKQLDKHIVNRMNKFKYKLYSREGKTWEKKKQKVVDEFLNLSKLNEFIVGESDFPIDIMELSKK